MKVAHFSTGLDSKPKARDFGRFRLRPAPTESVAPACVHVRAPRGRLRSRTGPVVRRGWHTQVAAHMHFGLEPNFTLCDLRRLGSRGSWRLRLVPSDAEGILRDVKLRIGAAVGSAERRSCNASSRRALRPRQLARMTPEQILRDGLLPRFEHACSALGQDWFEQTRAAQVDTFSKYIGEQLGWCTRATRTAMNAESGVMGRLSMEIQAANPGPFSASARRVLRGLAPTRSRRAPLLRSRARGRALQRRPRCRARGARSTRAGPRRQRG